MSQRQCNAINLILWTTVGHALDKCVDDRYFGTCFVCDLYGALDNGFGLLVQAVRIREKGVERSSPLLEVMCVGLETVNRRLFGQCLFSRMLYNNLDTLICTVLRGTSPTTRSEELCWLAHNVIEGSSKSFQASQQQQPIPNPSRTIYTPHRPCHLYQAEGQCYCY